MKAAPVLTGRMLGLGARLVLKRESNIKIMGVFGNGGFHQNLGYSVAAVLALCLECFEGGGCRRVQTRKCSWVDSPWRGAACRVRVALTVEQRVEQRVEPFLEVVKGDRPSFDPSQDRVRGECGYAD